MKCYKTKASVYGLNGLNVELFFVLLCLSGISFLDKGPTLVELTVRYLNMLNVVQYLKNVSMNEHFYC